MENLITKLLDDFDCGRMTRRQLIESLSVVAAAAAGATPAVGESSKGFKAIAVSHISYQVKGVVRRCEVNSRTSIAWRRVLVNDDLVSGNSNELGARLGQ